MRGRRLTATPQRWKEPLDLLFFFSFQLGTRAISGATVDIHIFFSSFFAAPPRLFLTEQWLKFTATARGTEAYCMFSLPSKQPFPIPTASSSPVAHAP